MHETDDSLSPSPPSPPPPPPCSCTRTRTRLESKPPPLLFHVRLVLGKKGEWKRKSGREGFCFRVNAALGLTTRPAGYTCGRLPYLLRPSNKPQTSSRGKGWRGKEYSREILSLVNGRGFSKVGEGEFCANFVFYGIAAASHTCTCSCTHVRLFFSVRCNDNVREGGEGSTCQSESRTFAMVRPGPWNNRFLSRDLSGKWNFRLALAKTLVHIQLIEPLNLISIVSARLAQDFLVDDYARRGWCS